MVMVPPPPGGFHAPARFPRPGQTPSGSALSPGHLTRSGPILPHHAPVRHSGALPVTTLAHPTPPAAAQAPCHDHASRQSCGTAAMHAYAMDRQPRITRDDLAGLAPVAVPQSIPAPGRV